MKKVILLVLASVALIGLSGCNTEGLQGNISKVDILDLHEGYAIVGYDNVNNNSMEIDFCSNKYSYYKGNTTYHGTFNIKDSNIENSRINFFDNRPHKSYRIDTDVDANAGSIEVGKTYEVFDNSEYIEVRTIRKDDSACQ